MARRFSSTRPSRTLATVAVAALAAVGGAARHATAQDAPPASPPAAPPAQPGATYKNKELGLSVDGPPGWRLVEGATSAPQWTRLASFVDADPATGGQILVASRRAFAFTLPKLRAEVTKTYADDKTYTVTGITDVPATGKRPLPGVMVDATQAQAPPPPPAGAPPSATPALPIVIRMQGIYLLGGDWEYLFLAQARATRFIGIQAWVDKVFASIALKVAGSALAERGGSVFTDDVDGFRCRYPENYGVRLPDRTQHLVEFAPASSGPIIGVFMYETNADLDHEAKVLLDYYTGPEVGGEASDSRTQIAGREAAVVTAKGRIGGRDQVFFVAVLKRGDVSFRLRVAADATQEAAGKATFDAFTKSFVLTGG